MPFISTPLKPILLHSADKTRIVKLFPIYTDNVKRFQWDYLYLGMPFSQNQKDITCIIYDLPDLSKKFANKFVKQFDIGLNCNGQLRRLSSHLPGQDLLIGDNIGIKGYDYHYIPLMLTSPGIPVHSSTAKYKWANELEWHQFNTGASSTPHNDYGNVFVDFVSEGPESLPQSNTIDLQVEWLDDWKGSSCGESITLSLRQCPITPAIEFITKENDSIIIQLAQRDIDFVIGESTATEIGTTETLTLSQNDFTFSQDDANRLIFNTAGYNFQNKYHFELFFYLAGSQHQYCTDPLIISPYVFLTDTNIPITDTTTQDRLYDIDVALLHKDSLVPFSYLKFASSSSSPPTQQLHQTDTIQIYASKQHINAGPIQVELQYKVFPGSSRWITLKTLTIDTSSSPIAYLTFPITFSTPEARIVFTSTSTSGTTIVNSERFVVHAACTAPTTPFKSQCNEKYTCGVDGICQCISDSCKIATCNCVEANTKTCNDQQQCICKDGFDGERCQNKIECGPESKKQCNYPNGIVTKTNGSNCSSTCECNTTNLSTFWAGKQCNVCTLQCFNNGQLYRQCDKCGCQAGYSGQTCTCISKQVRISINGYNELLHEYKLALEAATPTQPITSSQDYDYFVNISRLIHNDIGKYIAELFSFDNPARSISLNIIDATTSNPTTNEKTLSSHFEVTFHYGCPEFNPNITTQDITERFNEFIIAFVQSDIIKQYFVFQAPAVIDILNPVQNAPNTLPTGEDVLPENTSPQHFSLFFTIAILTSILSFLLF